MGWSAKHGLRPNRPRPVTVYMKDGQKVRVRRPLRKDGWRVVGVLTRSIAGVRRVTVRTLAAAGLRFERQTWSQDFRLHPTKGYRVATEVRKASETTKNSRLPKDWRLGVHEHDTFKRGGVTK